MDRLADLLAGRFRDPDSGAALSVPVKSVVIAASLAGQEADLVASIGLKPPFGVVSDDNTGPALGRRVEEALAALGPVVPIRLGARPHPDDRTADRVMEQGRDAASYIAVGAGTINDLAKYAAARQGKRYAVFGTAPSMNGYTSVNAAITAGGHKKSLAATAADGVFIDLDIMANAPKRLIRAGFGDAICRSTAQADWLLAHRLLGQPYRRAPFALFAALEDEMMRDPLALVSGDRAAIERLVRILILSGFGMTICGGSYPASQGEHLISHMIEMQPPPGWAEPFHGEQVAVTTLTMARLQERMTDRPEPPQLHASALTEAKLIAQFGAEVGASCWAEIKPKLFDATETADLAVKLKSIWSALRQELQSVMRPAAAIGAALKAIGAPRSHGDIGLGRDYYAGAVGHAREIRNRYTFLDLAADSGLLDPETLIA
ncbi:sn-glycerol-1-phosphate dehydrogenase [soil metagenome]